eukprot:520327_1
MSRRSETKPNYKEPNNPRISEKEKIIEKETWVRFAPVDSIYKNFPDLNDKRSKEIPENIVGFEINKLGNTSTEYVVMHIKSDSNISKNMCVNLNDLHEEEYFNCITGNEEDLISIGLYSRSYLKQQKIKNPLQLFTLKIGEKVSINCIQTEGIVSGIITQKRLSRYWKEFKAPYYFVATRQQDKKYNQWIFQIQINTSGTYEDIFFTDIVADRMLKCIESGSDAYIQSTYIPDNETPLELDINTPYFGKKNYVIIFDSIINNCNNYRPKILTYQYLKTAIEKGLFLKVNLSSSDQTCIRNVANTNVCLTIGVYIEPYSMDKLLFHLKTDCISNICCELKSIKWPIPLTFHKNILGLSEVIHVNTDKSRVILSPQHDLHMLYDRKTSCIVLQKFTFHPENRDVVRIKNEQKLNSNKNK